MTLIRVAHSPDSDDAFMFYALAKELIDTGDLRFEHVLSDIESLNAYAHLDDRYALLGSGASMGDGYGPVLVAREAVDQEELREMKVAIPGRLTSASLALKMWNPALQTVTLSFDEIMPAVSSGEADAGVVIHEGQLTLQDEGFHKIVDLGEWWAEETEGLPLPLGGNVIRRDLGDEMCSRVAALLKQSIEYSLENRDEALDYALDYGRGLDRDKADRFVGMYVNDLTVDYGERGRKAMRTFLDRAFEERLIPKVPQLDFL